MTNKKIVIALVVIAIIAIGAYKFPRPQQSQPAPAPLGATPNLDGVDNPFITLNGLREWRGTVGMTATSSVLCAVKNPFNATSTIVAVSAESVSNGIAAANNLYISTSTSAFGSSTAALVSAFAMGTGQWSVELEKNTATTSSLTATQSTGDPTLLPGAAITGATNYVLGPAEFITWRIATGTPRVLAAYNRGSCSAIIKKI